MSMYRQLWLAIIVSMLLALAGSMLATLLSARAYLEQQLEMKNADNASALAPVSRLTLSPKTESVPSTTSAVSQPPITHFIHDELVFFMRSLS